jgi:hypothetical protein
MNLFSTQLICILLFSAVCISSPEKAVLVNANKKISPAFRVSVDFESGSARVLAIDSVSQTIRITPGGDSTRGMPVWWYLRLDGVDINRPITLEVVANEAIMHTDVPGKYQKIPPAVSLPLQATYSTNKKDWFHTAPGERQNNQMTYRVNPGASTLWLAWGPPFTASDAVAFVEKTAKDHPFAKAFTLCLSRENRRVPALRISEGDKPLLTRPAIWIHARQHAWESGGSWVATGFSDWLTSDNQHARWLRQNAEIVIVPVMDIDHVATGDGGKNALPQDHNRDWTDTPHWNEVAAAQKQMLQFAKEKRLAVFLDLHNPGPAARQLAVYVMNKEYVGSEAPPLQERFLDFIVGQFGTFKRNESKPPAVNSQIFYAVSEPWVAAHGNPNTIGFCIETPWNVPQGTTEGYKATGEKIATAVAAYIKNIYKE